MNRRIPLTDVDIGVEEIKAVTKVLRSKWLTMGDMTTKFEADFARMLGSKYAFAVANCTAALHLANIALGITKGDEVICPALTFVATANASRYCGAKIIFADIVSEQDWTIDPVDIEQKITKRTKAISVVHYAGFPCRMDRIMKIARKYNLRVIEDCAHSPLAWVPRKNGKKRFTGSIGDIGAFSFFGNKNMTTAEGGMVVTNNVALATKLRLLRSHGMTSLTFERHKGHANNYDVRLLGFNYRIDEIRSAVGIAQLQKLKKNNAKRRNVYRWYKNELSGNRNVVMPFTQRNIAQAAPHIMPVIIRKQYNHIKEELRKRGVQTSKHYDLIPGFTLYKGSKFKSKVKFIQNILTLPMSPFMRKQDVEYIGKILDDTKFKSISSL